MSQIKDISMNSSLFIISGQSGVGKTTIVENAIALSGVGKRVITCTSRQPRAHEEDGKDYHFLPRPLFQDLISNGEFAEYAEVYGNLYGTRKKDISESRQSSPIVYIIIDVQGAETLLKKYPEAHSIFITTTIEDLENRLKERGDESESIKKRLSAFDLEKEKSTHYSSIIINENDEVEKSINEFLQHIEKYHKQDLEREQSN